ncbi:MAG: hypothetical protein LBG65_04625 [Puniceicoccales bacterium]|jgi:hypothetical protein|nr:hypothetical protein [Puniceicoccales bacterium]
MPLLVGNTLPVTLIRTPVTMTPVTLDAARELLHHADRALSFWGHANTLRLASRLLDYNLKPATARPALILDNKGHPGLDGCHTNTVLVLSPDYAPGYRPAIGCEPGGKDILGWQCLLVTFE